MVTTGNSVSLVESVILATAARLRRLMRQIHVIRYAHARLTHLYLMLIITRYFY